VILVFVAIILSVSDIFQPKDVPGAEAAGIAITTTDIDTCGISTSASGNFTKSGAGTCYIKTTTGIINGNLIVSGGAKIRIQSGAQLVLAPGKEIIIDKGSGSEIIMETGGAADKGVVHGTVCVRDDDGDGYINSGTGFSVALNNQLCSSLNNGAAKYIPKSSAASLTEADCYNTDGAKYSCCSNGYRDYDKDGYGRSSDGYSCYAADASYNVVANNYDCNDSVAGITTNNTDYTTCGSGACSGSGSNVCTNGVTVYNTCVVSAQACCDAAGNPKANGTVISSCSSCNGTSAAPIAYANGTVCAYGSFGAYGNSAGSCNIYSSRPYYTCSSGSCSGSIAGYDYQYQYPPALGNVWNSSSWITANCSTNTGYGSGYYCSGSGVGSTSQRVSYGCNTGGGADTSSPTATCNQSTCNNRNENGVSCTGGVCVGTSNCSDGVDNDGDGYTDAADSACGGCGQCTPSSCCSSNGCYSNGAICSYGGWSAWAAGGSCYLYRSRAYYTWSNCSCNYAGTDYEYNFGANGQVVSGTSFVTASGSTNCGTGSYSCSGTTSIQLGYYGCNGGNSCSTYMGTYQTGTCSGQENSMCSGGSCQNFCTSGGPDNNGNGYVDNQDPYCPYSGCGQCTSGSCCNTSTGCYYGTGTRCSTGGFNNPGAGSCQRTATDQYCSGSSSSCSGSYGYRYENAPSAGYIWNGSSWIYANCSYNIPHVPYVCSGNSTAYDFSGCNTSGGIDATTRGTCTLSACVTGSSYYCSGNQAYLRTNGCFSGSCTYSDSPVTYCDGVSKVCSAGSCVSACSAGTYSGYSVPVLNSGVSTTVTKPACYRSSGGYYSATATCNSGSISITGVSGPYCYGGYTYTYGTWYQSTFGCYDVCVLSTCAAGSNGGYSYPTLSHASSPVYSRSITGGSCSANINCTDGSTYVQNESCTCNAGYYKSGNSCIMCGTSTYSSAGATSCTSCPSGMVNSGGGTSISSCYCNSGVSGSTVWKYYNCNGSTSDGCEVSKSCDGAMPGCPLSDQAACGYCGDGTCAGPVAGETLASCASDCGYCGDGYCTSARGEHAWTCYQDCGGADCSDYSDCGNSPNNYCQYMGFSDGYCSGGWGSCSCGTDKYNCDWCGYWTTYSWGKCVCY
jgi:hypothetical protein